jgi:hypothetical protein
VKSKMQVGLSEDEEKWTVINRTILSGEIASQSFLK